VAQKLHDREIALISGGLGDIGYAIGGLLADQGADIAIGDMIPEDLAQAKLDSLRARGIRVDYSIVDVADAVAVKRWVRNVAERLGVPRLVVPNAAIVAYCSTLSTTPHDFERHLRINLLGAFFMAQEAAALWLEKRTKGRIVFIGSWAAGAPHPQILPYSVAKAALRMTVRCMALELAPHGIFVNEVAPGFVDAGLSAQEFEQIPGSREECRKLVPTGKLLTSEDVARKVAFLLHPDSDEITGIYVTVDSGISLASPGYQSSPNSRALEKDPLSL
jgi:NAD(P)-dependent dehydrogenase (short-subunit alcohol dehydrogenase family)